MSMITFPAATEIYVQEFQGCPRKDAKIAKLNFRVFWRVSWAICCCRMQIGLVDSLTLNPPYSASFSHSTCTSFFPQSPRFSLSPYLFNFSTTSAPLRFPVVCPVNPVESDYVFSIPIKLKHLTLFYKPVIFIHIHQKKALYRVIL